MREIDRKVLIKDKALDNNQIYTVVIVSDTVNSAAGPLNSEISWRCARALQPIILK